MAEPQVSELMVRGIVVGMFAENCWIIGSRKTQEGIVIDPGDQAEDILHLAGDMGLDIKVIANTDGSPSGGVTDVMNMFSTAGGTRLAGMVEAFAQTPLGGSIVGAAGLSHGTSKDEDAPQEPPAEDPGANGSQ